MRLGPNGQKLDLILGAGCDVPPSREVQRAAYRDWCYEEIAEQTADLGVTVARSRYLRSLRGMDLASLSCEVIEARDGRRKRTVGLMRPGRRAA